MTSLDSGSYKSFLVSDGIANHCDADDDNDGVDDGDDADPLDPLVCQDIDNDTCDDCALQMNDPAQDGPDEDSDGICNNGDTCLNDPINDPDQDGVCAAVDNCPDGDNNFDNDSDGIPNFCDACIDDPLNDADSDGSCAGNDPCPDPGNGDDDGDGVCNSEDVCPGFDDSGDNDGDGVPNGCDLCPGGNDANDFDSDGIPDFCDQDDDNDGVNDIEDSADQDPTVCRDDDSDGCDDCTNGSFDPAMDGPDAGMDVNKSLLICCSLFSLDMDGLCDAGDTCPNDHLNDQVRRKRKVKVILLNFGFLSTYNPGPRWRV